MDMNILLSVAAGLAGFFIAYLTGNKVNAILIPAGTGGAVTLLTVLSDPKSLGFFGPVGLVAFALMASYAPGLGAATGCLVGILLRKQSESTHNPLTGKWAVIGVLLVVAIATSIHAAKGIKMKDLEAVAEAQGAAFLKQQDEVISKTGAITRIEVFTKGHNQDGYPRIIFFVNGEHRDADVIVDISGTEESPIFSLRSVESRP